MEKQGKLIILIGVIIIVLGIIVWFADDKLRWLGRLPGDIRIERQDVRFYFPITTMILISAVLSLILWLINRAGR